MDTMLQHVLDVARAGFAYHDWMDPMFISYAYFAFWKRCINLDI